MIFFRSLKCTTSPCILKRVRFHPSATCSSPAFSHRFVLIELAPWLLRSCKKLAEELGALRALKKKPTAPSSVAPTEAVAGDVESPPPSQTVAVQRSPIRSPTPVRKVNVTARALASSTNLPPPKLPQISVRDKMRLFPTAAKTFPPTVLPDGSEQPSYPTLRLENPPGCSLFAPLTEQEREIEVERMTIRKRKYAEAQADPELRREFEEARKKKRRVKPDRENLLNFPLRPKTGYCECCCRKYDDFDTVRRTHGEVVFRLLTNFCCCSFLLLKAYDRAFSSTVCKGRYQLHRAGLFDSSREPGQSNVGHMKSVRQVLQA